MSFSLNMTVETPPSRLIYEQAPRGAKNGTAITVNSFVIAGGAKNGVKCALVINKNDKTR